MGAKLSIALLGLAVALPAPCFAQNATLEVTQGGLNKLTAQLGAISDSGTYQPTKTVFSTSRFTKCISIGYLDCPVGPGAPGLFGKLPLVRCVGPGGGSRIVPAGNPVGWQWWVRSASFSMTNGSATFTVTVETRVGTVSNTVTRSAPVSVSYNPGTNRIRVNINPIVVSVDYTSGGSTSTVTTADVARLYSFSIPIEPQTVAVSLPNGATRTITGRALSVTPQYVQGKIILTIDVGF
jgi:hypothetical protein